MSRDVTLMSRCHAPNVIVPNANDLKSLQIVPGALESLSARVTLVTFSSVKVFPPEISVTYADVMHLRYVVAGWRFFATVDDRVLERIERELAVVGKP